MTYDFEFEWTNEVCALREMSKEPRDALGPLEILILKWNFSSNFIGFFLVLSCTKSNRIYGINRIWIGENFTRLMVSPFLTTMLLRYHARSKCSAPSGECALNNRIARKLQFRSRNTRGYRISLVRISQKDLSYFTSSSSRYLIFITLLRKIHRDEILLIVFANRGEFSFQLSGIFPTCLYVLRIIGAL